MEYDIAPDESAFRDEVRQWLSEHLVGEFAAHRGVGSPTDDTAWERAHRLGEGAVRRRLARPDLAEGVRRPRCDARPGGRLRDGVRPSRRAGTGQLTGLGAARADVARVRHRGAEAPLPAADPERRRHLGPGLQRTGSRLGHRGGVVPSAARRGPVGHRRSEGVDDVRAPGRLAVRRVPHPSGRVPAPQGPDDAPRAGRPARRGDPAHREPRRLGGVQRVLLHRRPDRCRPRGRRTSTTAGGS